jgi:hypothetical protein
MKATLRTLWNKFVTELEEWGHAAALAQRQ